MRDVGFTSCKADPDVWMRPAVKPDGTKIYEYVLCYVDDLITQGLDPKGFMDWLETIYKLKEGSIKSLEAYLGADISAMELSNGKKAWAMSSDTFVKRAVAEVEREFAQGGKQLKKSIKSPLTSGYRPEFDATPELDEVRSSYYWS